MACSKGKPRKTVLIVMPRLRVLGGGEAVAVWMIEALKDDYDLSVVTWTAAVDTVEINRVYGTSLTLADFNVLGPPAMLRVPFDLLVKWNHNHYFQKVCLLYRMAQRAKNDFDILISTLGEVDFGRPGIQYIHYPDFKLYRSEANTRANGRPKGWLAGLKARCRPWRLLSGFSFERMKQNLTLVNSDWTGEVVREVYGIETHTVFPPVAGDFPEVPWTDREDRFVCIGRVVWHKRLEMIIAILAAVRARGHDVHLQIIGLPGHDPAERTYYEEIKRLLQEHASWVQMAEEIERDKLAQILCHSRYGIHAATEEPFGIAVAEMVEAGCITFTGRAGGQAEIIGYDERLIFESVEEGMEKISRVLGSRREQAALLSQLAENRGRFTTDSFVRKIREVVERFGEP